MVLITKMKLVLLLLKNKRKSFLINSNIYKLCQINIQVDNTMELTL